MLLVFILSSITPKILLFIRISIYSSFPEAILASIQIAFA